MEEHFEGQTPYIQMNGETPFANSKPFDQCFIGKHIKKELRNTEYECKSFMNVIFERRKALRLRDTYTWKLRDVEFNVVLLGKTDLFVKGKHVFVYCVGIVE